MAYLAHDPDSQVDPATQQCRAVAALARELLLPAVRVETNGIGRFLPALLRREIARAGAPCAVVEHTSRQSKALRILAALEPALAARRLHAHEGVFRTPFRRRWRDGGRTRPTRCGTTRWTLWPAACSPSRCACPWCRPQRAAPRWHGVAAEPDAGPIHARFVPE